VATIQSCQIETGSDYNSKGDWPEVDRALNFVSSDSLDFTASSASLLLAELLDRYAASTVRKVLLYVRASNHWAIEEELLAKNFYSRLFKSIPKSQKSGRSQKCFEKHEIEHIFAAFASNEFGVGELRYDHLIVRAPKKSN
jgi:hypothetical protein